MAEFHVELRLPLISVGADKISLKLPGRRERNPGLVQIVSRSRFTAVDTGGKTHDGAHPENWPPHAEIQQLWSLEPTGHPGLVRIISLHNGLALDATPLEDGDDMHLRMCRPADKPWQHWQIEAAPDKIGVTIATAYARDRRFLALGHDAQPQWSMWFGRKSGDRSTEWVISQPIRP